MSSTRSRPSNRRRPSRSKSSRWEWEQLLENLPCGVLRGRLVHDAQGRPDDFLFLDLNSGLEKIFGLNRSQLCGRTGREIAGLIPGLEQRLPEWVRFFAGAADGGEPAEMEHPALGLGKWVSLRAWCPAPGEFAAVATVMDRTDTVERDRERELTVELLRLLNQPNSLRALMQDVTALLQSYSGCEAVGVRLMDGADYPYFETRGFSPEFVAAESSLCIPDAKGRPLRDPAGNPVLECMCGNVLRGRFDPAQPFFTAAGSFWTNSTTRLLSATSETDRLARTRNRCHGEGYESVALVPLRGGEFTYGLLQVNDRRVGMFTSESVALFERLAGSIAAALARRQAEQQLRELGSRLEAVISSSPTAIVTTDRRGIIASWNPAAERIFGYPAAQAVSRPLRTLVPPEERVASLELQARAVRGEALTDITTRRLRRDGTMVPVGLSLAPLFGSRSEVIGVVWVFADISERARLEEQLVQARKMESVGRLAGGMAHDFNNLLTTISGYAGLALEGLPGDLPARGDLEEVIRAAESGTRLTRQLLAFSRRQTMSIESVDLNLLISRIEEMLRRLIGEDVEVQVIPDGDLPAVKADPAQIEQVLMNLAVNARDAMPEGGRFTIETATVDLAASDLEPGASRPPGRYVCLKVSDSGAGIPDGALPHIFEPFFTTKAVGQGTGLGLSMVYGVIKQHGGEIVVRSRPGDGTSFSIYLPATAEPDVRAKRQRSDAPPPSGRETVLLVEDEPAVRSLTRRILHRLGYTVIEATDGQDALRLAEALVTPPHLLLTDLVMPRLGGVELARRLRSLFPGIKVLYSSGYTEQIDTLNRAIEQGDSYIAKPFDTRTLAGRVRELLDRPAG